MGTKLFRQSAGIVLCVLMIGLTACGREMTAELPTAAAPAAVPTLPQPTSTLAQLPTQVATPVATPGPTPCAFAVQPRFAAIWNIDELGCPVDAGLDLINTAYAPFEGGQMLWRGDTATIYVLTNDNRWSSYPDEWKEGDPEYTCGEEPSPPTPVRGFGRVWCLAPGVREALGAVTAYEIGASDSDVQDFANGTILQAPWGSIFVFAGEQWRRVEPEG